MLKTKVKEIKREWHHFNAADKVLGRLATEIASLLIGKSKPYYVPHLDCGDYVVVTNAARVRVTGEKEKKKIYTRYSGYPGGLKRISLERRRREHPERLIWGAVSGMLPKNKWLKRRLKRLWVYPGSEHPHGNKF